MKNSNFKLFVVLSFAVAIIFTGCGKDDSEPLPEVAFEINGGNRPAPATVEFINATEDADSFLWEFGDGNTSDETNPTHTYEEPGNYTVKLTATNDAGSNSSTMRIKVYGTILSWTPTRISVLKDKWETHEGREVYPTVKHANGNWYDYVADETIGVVRVSTISFQHDDKYILSNIAGDMSLSMTNGSVIFEIREHQGGTSVDINNDPLLFSHTLRISDIIPDNATDPYLTEVILENEGVEINVKFNEAE